MAQWGSECNNATSQELYINRQANRNVISSARRDKTKFTVNLASTYRGIFPECSQVCAVHGESENVPLLCCRVFGLWLTSK